MEQGKRKLGFTLIEMLIAISIFTIFIGIAFSSYLHITKVQTDANETRSIYSETRYLADLITEDIRLMAIDYDCYLALGSSFPCNEISSLSADSSTQDLALVSRDGLEKVFYRFRDGRIFVYKQLRTINDLNFLPAPGFSSEFLHFSSESVNIEDLKFVIYPKLSPYDEDNNFLAVNFQPFVRILMRVSGQETENESFDLDYQTTVSTRFYGG